MIDRPRIAAAALAAATGLVLAGTSPAAAGTSAAAGMVPVIAAQQAPGIASEAAADPAAPAPATPVPAAPAPAAPAPGPVDAHGTTSVSLRGTGSLRPGERLRLRAVVRVDGERTAKVALKFQRRAAKGEPWRTLASDRTSARGRAVLRVVARTGEVFRVKGRADGKRLRAVLAPSWEKGPRTLGERADLLSKKIGASQGKARTWSRAKRVDAGLSASTKVRSREYRRGLLVEVTQGAKVRTWWVPPRLVRAFATGGGILKRYGVPRSDATCGLLERGCTQRFSRGTVYANGSEHGATGSRGVLGEIIAAGRSQVGYVYRYRAKTVQHTKFNRWMGSTRPWCSFFLSWASQASGNGNFLRRSPSFTRFARVTGEKMATGSKARVGALAFFANHGAARGATHVALVTKVSGGRITTLEGNNGWGLGNSRRGVVEMTWSASTPVYYAYPEY